MESDGGKMSEQVKCDICGEPMPAGEEMFKFHGYSGPCPKPPLIRGTPADELAEVKALLREIVSAYPQRKIMRPFIDKAKAYLK